MMGKLPVQLTTSVGENQFRGYTANAISRIHPKWLLRKTVGDEEGLNEGTDICKPL